MRVEFLPSIDFNQMLVYSTFVHLLFLTWVIFLPGLRTQEQIVVPTFKLDLIELSPRAKPGQPPGKRGNTSPAITKKKTTSKSKPVAKKLKKSVLRSKAKQLPSPKPVIEAKQLPSPKPVIEAKQLPSFKPIVKESESRKKILEGLKSFESDEPKWSSLQKLDALARLAPKAQKEKLVSPKLMPEETFRENEKDAELPLKPEPKIELPLQSEPEKFLPQEDDAAITARETGLPLQSEPETPLDDLDFMPQIDDEITAKERELAALLEQSVKLDLKSKTQTGSTNLQPFSPLLKELEAIGKKEVHPSEILLNRSQFKESKDSSAFKSIKGESLSSVVEKFQELEKSSEEIKVDISQGKMVLNEFQTSIQRDGAPVPKAVNKSEASSALSLYVGEVYKRVYSRWKTPTGSKFNDVMVSFTIFSKGNVSNPTIRKGTGDNHLDSIAVRAIMDSVPFPVLPKNLHRSNLKISIIFKYVPEKK